MLERSNIKNIYIFMRLIEGFKEKENRIAYDIYLFTKILWYAT